MIRPVKTPDSPESAPPSFPDLMADHQPRLAAYIRSLVPDEHSAKDILQETNVTLLKKSRDFEPGTNFTAWSFRVAFFEVLTWKRRKGREKLDFDPDLIDSLAATVETVAPGYEDRLAALKKCLSDLPDRQREAIERRYLSSESVTEIAEHLGFKANAASQLLFRARTNLLKCIRANTSTPNETLSPSSR